MLCCAGLIGGYVVGQSLGGPWTIIAPAAGFGIGLAADMKFMKGHHKKHVQIDAGPAMKVADPVRAVDLHDSKAGHHAEQFGKT